MKLYLKLLGVKWILLVYWETFWDFVIFNWSANLKIRKKLIKGEKNWRRHEGRQEEKEEKEEEGLDGGRAPIFGNEAP